MPVMRTRSLSGSPTVTSFQALSLNTSIHDLPVEIICKIFAFSTQAEYPSFMLPSPQIIPRPLDFKYVSLDTLASVCKHWREIALSTPILWSTLFLSLDELNDKTLVQSRVAVNHCLRRSGYCPLACFITIDLDTRWTTKRFESAFADLLEILLSPLLRCQKRWEIMDIHCSPSWEHGSRADGMEHFMMHAEELISLKEIRVDTKMHYISGFSPLPSLSTLELVVYKKSELLRWLDLCPNVENLGIRAVKIDGNLYLWQAVGRRFAFRKLRTLRLDAPLSILCILDCPALEDLAITGGDDRYIIQYQELLSRIPPLRSFHVLHVLKPIFKTPARIVKFLVPSITLLSLTLNGGRRAVPDVFFELLSEKGADQTDAYSEPFYVLPKLESLVLGGSFCIPLAKLVDFIVARWNMKKGSLKSIRLAGCFIQLSENQGCVNIVRAGVQSEVMEAVKPFTDEGLEFEFS